MTREKLLLLIESWRAGDCPNEILLDAMIDYGIDVDKELWDTQRKTIRDHIIKCGNEVNRMHGPHHAKKWCEAGIFVERQLKEAPCDTR